MADVSSCTAGGTIMEGPFFRKLSDVGVMDVILRLQVPACSSPEDKRIPVEKLKSLVEIVGVIGDDGPALKMADVSSCTAGGTIMEGPFFSQLRDVEVVDVILRLQIPACPSPEDKKIPVKKLKSLGDIVGVTGHDGPALKMADVSPYTTGGIIMEGHFFKQLSDVEVMNAILRLQVLSL
jgi:magnesium-transporting ATPase (P-type)